MLDCITHNRAWRQDRRTKLTLRIGYVSRMILSVVFPVSGFVDAVCGAISIQLVTWGARPFGELSEYSPGFLVVLAITLVQGIVLNIVLVGFMMIVHAFQLAIGNTRR